MLKDALQEELKESLRSGDNVKRSVLSMLMASIKNRELVKRGQLSKTISDVAELEEKSLLSDEEVLEVISGEAKKHKESIGQFESAGRKELAEKEQAELEILKKYLPEQINEEELRNVVSSVISDSGASSMKDMGQVMSKVMAKVKGKADGTAVSKIVKEELSK